MKRKALVVFIGLVLAFTAFAVLPTLVADSSGVDNPTNVLNDDAYYALGKFSSSLDCPFGFTESGDYCEHDGSGEKISGWESLFFEPPNASGEFYNLSLKVANRDDGCSGSGCGSSVTTKVFAITNASGVWGYVGKFSTSYGAPSQVGLHMLNTTSYVMLARSASADSRPDIRWYWAKLENY